MRLIKKTHYIHTVIALLMLFIWLFGTQQQSSIQTGTIFNVRDYGALGDGFHDDTSSIQRVFDKANERNKGMKDNERTTVYFPEGTYMVNPQEPLVVHSNTKVFGEGKRSIIKADASNFGWDLLNVEGQHITIHNLLLDGNHAVNRVLVVRSNSSHIRIEDMKITNATQSNDRNSGYYDQVVAGIIIYGNTHNITIDESEIYRLTAPNKGWITRGIYITTMWNSREVVPKKVTITNSSIHHIGSADDGDCIYYEDNNKDNTTGEIADSLITNNEMKACAKRAIKLYANGIVVRDNHIINSYQNNNIYQADSKKGTMAPDMFAGISVYGDDITIHNNTLDGAGSFYAAIEVSATTTVNRIIISSNTIKMGARSNMLGTTGIRVGNIMDFTIRGNHIENGQKAIWIWQNAQSGVIEDNSIHTRNGGGIEFTKQRNNTQQDIDVSDNLHIQPEVSFR